MKKNKIIASVFALALVLSVSACAAEEEKKPEKKLPQDVISDVPLPYTGEVGRPKGQGDAVDSGLQIYQINDDGTTQEVKIGGETPAAGATTEPAETIGGEATEPAIEPAPATDMPVADVTSGDTSPGETTGGNESSAVGTSPAGDSNPIDDSTPVTE